MPTIIRRATPDDAALLVRVIDMASDGVIPTLWDAMAPEGMDGSAVGLALVTAADGDFSYSNGTILEEDGTALGGMIAYRLPPEPQPAGPDVPEAFVGVEELAMLVPDHWYINVVAIVPEGRGRGLGTALLDDAEARARRSGAPGLALIVAASNTGAIRAYDRTGYRERARRPFDASDLGAEPTEAVLMVKDLV